MSLVSVISSSGESVPNAPTIGTATDIGTIRAFTPQNGGATVTFSAPSFDGRSAILDYTATSSPGGFTGTASGSPITVNGLAPNTNYTFTVTARNAIGTGAASSASNQITATTVPAAPTIGTATATGATTATVAFTGNATGGKTITSYTATSSPGGLTASGATSPITVTGLTSGTAYTFTVTASNDNGVSGASGVSNSVTPVVPKPTVTGGTLTSDATYYYRTFTANGTLGVSGGTLNADVFMIAGGAGSGASRFRSRVYAIYGGNGGAGGFRYWNANYTSNQSITIGAGGAAGVLQDPPTAGGNGSNTVFGATTRSGGGGGGSAGSGNSGGGFTGGCGGGGGFFIEYNGAGDQNGAGAAGNSGGYSPVEGYNGANSDYLNGQRNGGGGGIGANATAAAGGSGGTYFGVTYGTGGTKAVNTPTNGANNTGDGAGAADNYAFAGGSGGSGIVVVRYLQTAV
jgi:hypothetical protein